MIKILVLYNTALCLWAWFTVIYLQTQVLAFYKKHYTCLCSPTHLIVWGWNYAQYTTPLCKFMATGKQICLCDDIPVPKDVYCLTCFIWNCRSLEEVDTTFIRKLKFFCPPPLLNVCSQDSSGLWACSRSFRCQVPDHLRSQSCWAWAWVSYSFTLQFNPLHQQQESKIELKKTNACWLWICPAFSEQSLCA